MSSRIYLTGATGYIGSALAARLAGNGHEVRALVRPTSETGRLRALGVTLCPGDLLDRYSMREGMSGSDWVIHAAAAVTIDGDRESLERANVEGSENVASLAYKLGVGRMLAVSSIAAFGGSPPDGSPATEESPVREPFPSAYAATKAAGERRVRQWAEQGLRLNVVYPSLVYGPPGKRGGSNALLRAIATGRFPALVGADRKASWVFLDDVVEAMVRIVEGAAEPRRDYLLAGEVATVGELADQVCRLVGTRPPRLRLSPTAARWALAAATPWFRLTGRRPPFGPAQVASLARHWAFDDSRARGELGWRPRSLAEGLPPTLDHLLGAGA